MVVSSHIAINLETAQTPYVLGAKTAQEDGFFKKYFKKILKILGLYEGDQKEPVRTFDYVPGRLKTTQPQFSEPDAFATPTPTPTTSPVGTQDSLPPLPPLPL